MLRLATLLLSFFVAITSAAPVPKVKVKDADAVLGKWTIVEMCHDGILQETSLRGAPVVFENGTMTVYGEDGAKFDAMGYKLDADKKHLDFQLSGEPEGAIQPKGIYVLDGDTLLIAVGMDCPNERPKEAKSGKGVGFLKLRRAKEEKK